MGRLKRRRFLIVAATLVAGSFSSAWAQSGKRARVGILLFGSAANVSWRALLLRALSDRGWQEGRNLTVDWRSANGVRAKLAQDAADLARDKYELVIAVTASEATAMQHASRRIPIVVLFCTEDPVEAGFAQTISHPGGNITGVLWVDPAFVVKSIQMVKEIFPQLQRIGEIYPAEAYIERYVDALEAAARRLNVAVLRYPVRGPEEIAAALQKAKNDRIEALRVVMAGAPQARVGQILAFAKANKLPTLFAAPKPVELGGLLSYTPSFEDDMRIAASLIDKVLRGAKPGDLPFESVTRYELVINLKTAKELGVTIPPSVLISADRLIQ
jgi:putative ABC transport system substrate-binding protein